MLKEDTGYRSFQQLGDARRANNLETIEDLGRHIRTLTALLRAAINTGANEREDEAWLIAIAPQALIDAGATQIEIEERKRKRRG